MTGNCLRKLRGAILCVMVFAVFAVGRIQNARGVWNPVPFTIQVSGNVNGVDFSVQGSGIVDPIGTYSATLTFSNMPPDFHPVFMTAYTVSLCCYYYGEEIRGGINLHTLLGDDASYDVVRNLYFPLTGDGLSITGTVESVEGQFGFVGTITGTTSNPGDLTGKSSYRVGLTPGGPGIINGAGDGDLTRSNNKMLPVEVETLHSFDPTRSLPFEETREVDERGSGDGLTYTLVLDSTVFRYAVGGVWVPIDKFGLLAPYVGLASTVVVAIAATAIHVKLVKRRKEKR